jgi:hypothetical protein
MQLHRMCAGAKVTNLTEIFGMIEATFPNPPADKMFISINRRLLEIGAETANVTNNQLAVDNLNALNRALAEGLWGGRVTVFDKDPPTEETAGVLGAAVAYFMSLQSTLFIGTEVSSFSMDVISARFYQGNRNNYLYHPSGLKLATPEDAIIPPVFLC